MVVRLSSADVALLFRSPSKGEAAVIGVRNPPNHDLFESSGEDSGVSPPDGGWAILLRRWNLHDTKHVNTMSIHSQSHNMGEDALNQIIYMTFNP